LYTNQAGNRILYEFLQKGLGHTVRAIVDYDRLEKKSIKGGWVVTINFCVLHILE